MSNLLCNFVSIWCIAVAVERRPGERLEPIALAAMDLAAAEVQQVEMPKLRGIRRPPYPTGQQTVIVTVDAQLLAGCHLALGWRMPKHIIDLLVEHRNERRSARIVVGGLAGAFVAVGQPAALGLASGTSPSELHRRLGAIARLFDAMRDTLDVGRSLLRGRYLCAVAKMESTGIPIDGAMLARLRKSWPSVLDRIIATIDADFGVYQGRRLDLQAFTAFLDRHHIDWPRTTSGGLDLGDDVFRMMTQAHPELRPLKELRSTLIGFHPRNLAIGRDGRNRVPLNPFSSSTGRNQPSAKAFVLGAPAWVRHVIKPPSGVGLAMLDWCQQEFGIAAALSGDEAMQAAYASGDPYMALAVAARAAPDCATVTTHADVRERFKRCALGVQYGMGKTTLARHVATSEYEAAELIASHKAAFPRFWAWSKAVESYGLLHRELRSVFGWRLAVGADANPRSIRNFPMQANGAEMLRLACCLITEAGIRVCAPNHDAIMIEAPISQLNESVAEARHLMAEASAVVLDGFALRTSVRAVRAPARWTEPRGQAVWSAVKTALGLDSACSPA